MTSHAQHDPESRLNIDNMGAAISHILWTIERSPKAYAMYRQKCIGLRQALVNAELRHQEEKS